MDGAVLHKSSHSIVLFAVSERASYGPGEERAPGVRAWVACPRDPCRFLPIRIRVEKSCNFSAVAPQMSQHGRAVTKRNERVTCLIG